MLPEEDLPELGLWICQDRARQDGDRYQVFTETFCVWKLREAGWKAVALRASNGECHQLQVTSVLHRATLQTQTDFGARPLI